MEDGRGIVNKDTPVISKYLEEYIWKVKMNKKPEREEDHFINQLSEHLDELNDNIIDTTARQILHKMYHLVNRYAFNQMQKRREKNVNSHPST